MSSVLNVDDDELSVHAAMISDAVEQAQQHGEEADNQSINQSINELCHSFDQENEQSNHGSMFRLPKLALNQANKQPIYSSILAPSREDSISCCARVLYDRIVQSSNSTPNSESTNQSFGSSYLPNYQSPEYDNLNDQSSIDADPFDVSHFARTVYQTRLPTNLMTSILSSIPTVVYRQSIKPTICPCPSLHTIQSFIQHVFNVCNLSIECTVIAVLYIDRLESIGHSSNQSNHQSIRLHVRNWMPLLLTSLLAASKVWDDQSSHNADFVHVLPGLTIKHLNHLEREFLSRIQYELYIASSEYARYFFAMRDVKTRQEKMEKLQLQKKMKRESISRSISQSIRQSVNQPSPDSIHEDAQTEQDREIDALTRGMTFTKAELEPPRPTFYPRREMPMSL